jgi:hypothetical protein
MGLRRKTRRLLEVARYVARLSPPHSRRFLPTVLKAERLCRKQRFRPPEAFRLGLFRPDAAYSEGRYISQKKLARIQRPLNPEPFAPVVRDKSIFYPYCLRVGIPVPRLYAIRYPHAALWFPDGPMSNVEDRREFFFERLPAEFVTKLASGSYGRGLSIFTSRGGALLDAEGNRYTADDAWDHLCRQAGDDALIFQERLSNHEEIMRLSDTPYLQTARIITLVGPGGAARVVHAHFKPIVGDHIVDTYAEGLTGNVEAEIDVPAGRLNTASQILGTGEGARVLQVHPKTGIPFRGFRLPFWPEACRLVCEAAPKLLPLRTLGWDVALTPDGPRALEANVWWYPPNQHANTPCLIEALLECVRALWPAGAGEQGPHST